jgi:hypothetical protein
VDLITEARDLTDERNVVDAEYELTRAQEADRRGDTSALLAWVRKWARPAVVALVEFIDAPPRFGLRED